MDMDKHYKDSMVLIDHLTSELSTFADTNDLVCGDIMFVINGLLVNIFLSYEFKDEHIGRAMDLMTEKILKQVQDMRKENEHS